MMGDAVDNIPGLPGVGEKTAKKLLAEYGNMEGLLENAHLVKGKLGEKIQAHKEQGILSKRLATILLDAPVEIDETALAVKKFDAEKVQALFEELEFKNLAKRLLGQSEMPKKAEKSDSNSIQKTSPNDGQMDLFAIGVENTPPAPSYQTIEDLKTNYTLVESSEQRTALLEQLLQQQSVCFDTETTGLNPLKADIIGMSFSYQKNEAYYVHITEGQEQAVVNEFKSFFEHTEIEKVAQNLKYDYKVLAKYGVHIKAPIFDTMLAHYLLEPDQRHNMDVLAQNYLNYSPISIETLIGKKGKNQLSMRQAPLEQLYPYACEDADITFQLKEIFHKKLDGSKSYQVFKKIEMPLIPVLSAMEMEGIKIDTDALSDFSKELEQKIVELNDNVQQLAGTPFNLASPKQLGQILFEHMKLVDKPKKTKTGQYSTSEDTLLKLKGKHAIIDDILEFRQLQKLKSTYVDALPEVGRCRHTTYSHDLSTGSSSYRSIKFGKPQLTKHTYKE